MSNYNRNTKKSYKIVDSEGNIIKYFRTKCAAVQLLPDYQKTYVNMELRIEKN